MALIDPSTFVNNCWTVVNMSLFKNWVNIDIHGCPLIVLLSCCSRSLTDEGLSIMHAKHSCRCFYFFNPPLYNIDNCHSCKINILPRLCKPPYIIRMVYERVLLYEVISIVTVESSTKSSRMVEVKLRRLDINVLYAIKFFISVNDISVTEFNQCSAWKLNLMKIKQDVSWPLGS